MEIFGGGENEDILFPVDFLYKSKHGVTQREEVGVCDLSNHK